MSSHLNEPLNADIELLDVNPNELLNMKARVASIELYREANVGRPGVADELKFAIEKRDDGRAVIHVTTASQIVDSHFEVLVEVTWPQGRLIRDYAFELEALKISDVEVPAPARAPQVVETPPDVSTPPVAEATPPPVSSDKTPKVKRDEPSAPVAKTVKVKPGDTLASITQRIKPEAILLEQSMMAVFEANRRAFLRGNANLIRSGAILQVPEGEAWTATTNDKAREELHLMAEDFEAYKASLARASHSESAAESSANEGSKGKIAGATDDKTLPTPKGGQDVLRLSRKDDAPKNAKAREDLEKEDAIVRENELKEAKERAAALEKNVDAMKKLLEKKDAEAKAGHKTPSETAQEILPETVKPHLAEEDKETARAEKAELEKPQAPKPELDDAKAPKKEAKKEKPAGFFSSLLQHPVILLAGVISLVLVGWLTFSLVRRRPRVPMSDDDEPMDDKVAASPETETPAHLSSESAAQDVTPPIPVPAREDVDPLDEADVYIAYGRLSQAEEILLKAIALHPGRLELLKKLMDVYVQQARKSDFEQSYRTLVSLAAPDNPLIGVARQLGRELDPTNTLYQDINIVPPTVALNDLVPPIPGEVEKTPQSLADIDLSLSVQPPQPEDESSPVFQEMNTKLDLARAYIDIEDKDNAREILAEIMEKGSARQKAEAARLDQELGG